MMGYAHINPANQTDDAQLDLDYDECMRRNVQWLLRPAMAGKVPDGVRAFTITE